MRPHCWRRITTVAAVAPPSLAATAPASGQWRRDRLKNGAGSAAGDAQDESWRQTERPLVSTDDTDRLIEEPSTELMLKLCNADRCVRATNQHRRSECRAAGPGALRFKRRRGCSSPSVFSETPPPATEIQRHGRSA